MGLSANLRHRLVHLALVHCGKMLCGTDGRGSGVMDAEQCGGCQKTQATIWAFLGRVTVPLQVWWQEQRKRVVSVREHFLFKGEVGMLLAHLILPLYPSQKGRTVRGHIAILNRCRRIQTHTCTHLQAYRVINSKNTDSVTRRLYLVPSLSMRDPWWRGSGVPGSSSLTFRIVSDWASMTQSNYRQPLHIHWWPDWLGIPHGTTPKPLTRISNANSERCGEMDSSYTRPRKLFLPHTHTKSVTGCHPPHEEVNNGVISGFYMLGSYTVETG